MVLNRRSRDFQRAALNVFNTVDGKLLLKYLKEDILDETPIGLDVNKTYYNIGQADLVRQLIVLSKNEDAVENTNTVDYSESTEIM